MIQFYRRARYYISFSLLPSLSFSIDQHVTEKLKFIDRLIIPSKALSVSWGDGLSNDRNQDGNIKYMRGELVWVAVVSWVAGLQGGVSGRALLYVQRHISRSTKKLATRSLTL